MEKWPSRVAAARRSGRIPETKELHGSWCHGGYEIKLADIPAWRLAALDPVPVPSRLTRPHTAIRAMQNERQPLGLTKPVQGRALRLIQALITAAEAIAAHRPGGSSERCRPERSSENPRSDPISWPIAMHVGAQAIKRASRPTVRPFNPVAPAFANTLLDATGVLLGRLPLSRDRVWLVVRDAGLTDRQVGDS
ncbi:hypothetical protein [Streptomyces echinatus]|uniref:Uncharacterized protein n=1 Tax=Streptomyces echinatus TaxID=67293 RepID=A0A7W9PXJ0_9ACTN|nr:hypothetical protein [Streptomyces echinatus]MBB5929794.1 hypothetical protein [Streptomyces echinatus]